jgi:hypothetical protein
MPPKVVELATGCFNKTMTSKAASTALQALKHSNPGCVVSWPPSRLPYSPELSPIENVWAYVQSKVNAKRCKILYEFKDKVMHTFHNLPQYMLNYLNNNMSSRDTYCIEVEGDKTKY